MKIGDLKSAINKLNFILSPSQKKWGIVVLFLSIIGAIFEMLGISVILPLVQAFMTPETLLQNKLISDLAEQLNITTTQQLIVCICIMTILVYWIKNAYLLFLVYVRSRYVCKVQRELSVKMMTFYMARGYSFFIQKNISELMRGISNSISSVCTTLLSSFKIISEVLTIAAIVIFITLSDIAMAFMFLVIAICCLALITFVFRKSVKKCGDRYHRYLEKVNKAAYQAFEGIKEVLVMQRQRYFSKTYESAYVKMQKAIVGQNVANESPTYVIEAMSITLLLVMIIFRFATGSDAAVMIPSLASFAVAAFRILPSLGKISGGINSVGFYSVAIDEVYNNFKEVEKIEEYSTAKESTNGEITQFNDRIELKDIMWKYPNSEKEVFSKLNLTIKKGQSVAFVGQSGAGKTTLVDVLLRLLNPDEGTILVDGIDMKQNNLGWGNMIGFVSQIFYLNDDTIRNNVAFGVDEKSISDDLVWRALEQAQLKDYVETLPEGIYTRIGERGIRFSGGQRQRLAIARALYYNPEILVLDEATSALDTETETSVMEAIEALQGEKTLIIVAHRLTTIRNCDVIYEIVNGTVIERKYNDL